MHNCEGCEFFHQETSPCNNSEISSELIKKHYTENEPDCPHRKEKPEGAAIRVLASTHENLDRGTALINLFESFNTNTEEYPDWSITKIDIQDNRVILSFKPLKDVCWDPHFNLPANLVTEFSSNHITIFFQNTEYNIEYGGFMISLVH